jgi:hypothetical protein
MNMKKNKNLCEKCGKIKERERKNPYYCDDCCHEIIKGIFEPIQRRQGLRILLSPDEVKLIIKALKYHREENGGDAELENDLKMVLKGTL